MPLQVTVNPESPILSTTTGVTPQSFTQKFIDVSIRLAGGTGVNQPNAFSNSQGSNTLTLSRSRTSVRVKNSGTPGGSEAEVQVWGVTQSQMDELSTLGMFINVVPRNTLTVMAGDAVTGMSTVFSGTIVQGYGDFNSSPSVPFHFECRSGMADDVIPATPSSYTGSTDVGTVMKSIANSLGYGFENNGVSLKINSPYLPGSYGSQWKKLARDAGIQAALVVGGADNSTGGLVLAIWPRNGSRGGAAPVISPGTGMIGYPSYTQQGILVRTVFNPQIGFGGQVVVQGSVLKKANGTWIVHKLDLSLDSMVDGGLWESCVYAYGSNPPSPILTPR